MKQTLTYLSIVILFNSCLVSIKKEQKEIFEETPSFTNQQSYPIYPGCENEKDPESCLMASVSDKILDQAIKENLNLLKDTLKVDFKINANGSSRILANETNNTELKRISSSVLNNLPLIEPGYSKRLEKHISSSYSFYIIIEGNKRINKL